ncbi:MAG: PAQR family membrane homeostasis protein TrhA [Flavobacteriaceae bacterium]
MGKNNIDTNQKLQRFYELPKDEQWNVVTHALGALASGVGVVILFQQVKTDALALLGLLIYGASMVFLFSASAIYHAASSSKKSFWQKVDHIGIYFLIAGTYTPVALTILKDSSGMYLLAGVWSIALFGTIYKIFLIHKFHNLSLFLYLAMGWLVILDIDNVWRLFPLDAFYALVAGGFFYTLGTVFYRWEKLYFHHVIWHFFVLAGAFSHYTMVAYLMV